MEHLRGSYKCNDWTDQQGNKRRDYYVKAFSVQLLGQRPQQAQQSQAPGYAPAPAAQPQYNTPAPPAGYTPAPQPQYQPQAPAQAAYPPQQAQPTNPAYPPMNAPQYTQPQGENLPF